MTSLPDPPAIHGLAKPVDETRSANGGGGSSGAGTAASCGGGQKRRKWWEADYKPIVKCDIAAILKSTEPPSAIRGWVKILETIHPMRTNTGVPIRDAVVLAARTTRDANVKSYLHKALRYYKGNVSSFAAPLLRLCAHAALPAMHAPQQEEGRRVPCGAACALRSGVCLA